MNEREPTPASRANARVNDQSPTLMIIIHECLKLADLQLQLLQIDIVDFWKRSQLALGLLTLASGLLLGSLPIGLLAFSAWLERASGLSREFCLACTAAIGFAFAVTILLWAMMLLKHATEPLSRNQEELKANLLWMRNLLHQGENDDK